MEAALANTGWLARGYYRRKEREGQVVGSRVVWCILGVGKQGWGCGGDGWMDGYPPSRKKEKWRLLCWLRLREEVSMRSLVSRKPHETAAAAMHQSRASQNAYFSVQRGARDN